MIRHSLGTMPAELEARIQHIEKIEEEIGQATDAQGLGFTPTDWLWLWGLGIVVPIALLIWGWG